MATTKARELIEKAIGEGYGGQIWLLHIPFSAMEGDFSYEKHRPAATGIGVASLRQTLDKHGMLRHPSNEETEVVENVRTSGSYALPPEMHWLAKYPKVTSAYMRNGDIYVTAIVGKSQYDATKLRRDDYWIINQIDFTKPGYVAGREKVSDRNFESWVRSLRESKACKLVQMMVAESWPTFYTFQDEKYAWRFIDLLTQDDFNDMDDVEPSRKGSEWVVRVPPWYAHQRSIMNKWYNKARM